MNSVLANVPYWKGVGAPADVNDVPSNGACVGLMPAVVIAFVTTPVVEVIELITPRCETVEVSMCGRMLLAGVPGTLTRPEPARPKFSHSSEHQLRAGHLPMPSLFSYSPAITTWPRPPRKEVPAAMEYIWVLASPCSDSPNWAEPLRPWKWWLRLRLTTPATASEP